MVRHLVGSKVRGTFQRLSGSITIAEDGTPSVQAEIQVASIDNQQRAA